MKKIIRWGAAVLVLAMLVIAGCLHGVRREVPTAPSGSSAGLGLMLLEKENDAGLYVLAVTQDSPADRAGVHPGDYLLRAGETELQKASQLDALLESGEGELLLTLRRDGKQLQLNLPTR